MNLGDYDLNTLKDGFLYDAGRKSYACLLCGKQFEEEEIYALAGRFFTAGRAVREHLERDHGGWFQAFLNMESRYNTLTQNQKKLLSRLAQGWPDQAIAKEAGVSVSTVRHQKFVFREKAKQARVYLALYECAGQLAEAASGSGEQPGAELRPVHDGAKMVDDRYLMTQEEYERYLTNAFKSLEPLRLEHFPVKEKRKLAVLMRIIEEFQAGRRYTEAQVNEALAEIYTDYVTLRRYLIEYGFMDRTKDGAVYWVK